ncbi:Neoxanthin synthase, chloroplastic [Symbiodinium microadriaticum]|uniref:Neoxanthin synthase, chloroplastic n=1 Tax=Symbiodinium microadriaticum TaxID=2951 RepID=A0A1Q9DNM5_SYMMI|nr:Neoxanthin synthase, chloroplastic [Symbiodinium microadriaticum]
MEATAAGTAAGSRRKSLRLRAASKEAFSVAAEVFEEDEVDVAIIGAGPAGTLLAYLLAEQYGKKVSLIDPKADKKWPNNYGVWQAEWEALAEKLELDLGSCRLGQQVASDGLLLRRLLGGSKVQVLEKEVECQVVATNIYDSPAIRHTSAGNGLLIVDTTGFESRLTRVFQMASQGEPPAPAPGYQIAYGCEVVDGSFHYAPEAMTLFDYRTDHLRFDPAAISVVSAGVGCQAGRELRGISYRESTITDEEFCYIPMGGPLPEQLG